jgi:hypothetical protein
MKKEQSIQSVLHKLNAEPMKVKLSMIQDADALYSKIVQGAKSQVSILLKVEQELKSLEALAKQLQQMERKLESMEKDLGLDLNLNYASDEWVESLNKYADKVGLIADVL